MPEETEEEQRIRWSICSSIEPIRNFYMELGSILGTLAYNYPGQGWEELAEEANWAFDAFNEGWSYFTCWSWDREIQ